MSEYQKRGFSSSERQVIWKRWYKGEPITAIANTLNRTPPGIRGYLLKHGGICPTPRKRAERALTLAERERIACGLYKGESLRSIARCLGRSPSTVSREVNRNGGRNNYHAHMADTAAWTRAKRPQACKLNSNQSLSQLVAIKLRELWSPEQIAGWLKYSFPSQPEMQVSHETIYKSLYIQTRGALKKELIRSLRSKHKMRQPKCAAQGERGQIPELVSIRQRPASVEDRAVPGHWEGDLIVGRHQSYIATLVERSTRYVMLVKVNDCKTETVVDALIKNAQRLPKELYKSLTWDRGSELKRHREFTLATDINVYFCDPKSPWQRGSNENTNGLLRQYFPKGTDLSVHSQRKLDKVARQLNERPRKTLGFETPAQRFAKCVATTG